MSRPSVLRLRRPEGRLRRSRFLAVLASVAMGAGLVAFGTAAPANAAGSGVLDLTIAPVDASNGNSPITDAQNGSGPAGYASNNAITYLVQYSCATSDCDNAQVQLSPPPPDPHGLLPAGKSILRYGSWVAPSAIPTASITGDDTTGKLVTLGNLAAGSSGTFTVSYYYYGNRNKEVPDGSFYPEGYKIKMAADISSDTATGNKHANASDVTWHIGTPTGPGAALAPSGGTFNTDIPETFRIAVNPGNMVVNPGANQAGSADLVATGNYKIVYHLPPEADIQSATDGGVIDNTAHTVTWTKGSLASPDYNARGGWGTTQLSGYNSGGTAVNGGAAWGPRGVDVIFHRSSFAAEADPSGCNFVHDFQTSIDVTVNYLDAARTEGKITGQTMNARVACHEPYGGLNVSKLVAGGSSSQYSQDDGNMGGGIFAQNVPIPGAADATRYWTVTSANRGNVPGVATIDEPNLHPDPHLKVDAIYPQAVSDPFAAGWGTTVQWTLSDGTSGTTNDVTSASPLLAPAGTWFTSAKVVTDPIPPNSVLPTDGASTGVLVYFRFKVDDGAVIGTQVTNDATVSMTYPGYGTGAGETPIEDLSGNPLTQPVTTPVSRTIEYTQPSPLLYAQFVGGPVVDGGGALNAITPGTKVSWTVRAATNRVWPGSTIKPQVMYAAPEGWTIVPGSAAADASAPAGVTFAYGTKDIGGVQRDVVVATWPSTVTPSTTGAEYFGNITVDTKPSATAPAGVSAVATAFSGDASGNWSDATGVYITAANLNAHQFQPSSAAYQDVSDFDGDNDTTEDFAATSGPNGVQVAALPALDVTKEICSPNIAKPDGCDWVAAGPVAPVTVPDDEDIKYRLTMVNAGNVDLTNAVATDNLPHTGDGRGSQFNQTLTGTSDTDAGLALDFSGSYTPGAWGPTAGGAKSIRATAATLPIGASYSTVFTTDIPAGVSENDLGCNNLSIDSDQTIGTATGSVCAKVHVTVPPTPGLKLTKSATLTTDGNSNGKADKGDVITYSFKVENTGTVDMTGVGINDPMVTSTTPASADIAAGTDKTFTATYTVKQGDVDAGGQIHNSAKATGTWDDAGTPTSFDSNTSTADITVAAADPELGLSKTAALTTDNGTAGKADKDDVITYTITASNDGNVTLTDVSVTDPMAGLSAIAPASVATLAPQATATFTATYTVTQADVDAGDDVVNSATGHAKDPAGGAVTSSPATAKTPVIAADPDVSITKSGALTTDKFVVGKADAGDVITYTFTAHNGGLATAHDVSVTDPLPGLSAISPASVADLAPGDDATFTATYTVTRDDVVAGGVKNTATVSSHGPTRGGVVPTPVTATSNAVTVAAAALGTPRITTSTRAKVSAKVKKSGAMRPVRLTDKITVTGLRTGLPAGSGATGTAVLYGPTAHRTSGACVTGNVVKTLSFTPRNGTFRTASVKVKQPGYYTWVVSTGADALNDAATHGCGLKSETTLVHRKGYGKVHIETGFDGVTPANSFFARMLAKPSVSIKAIGLRARLDTVGLSRKSMVIPGNVTRAGWLSRSAAPGDAVGSTVIAGHVSNYYDRPGAFGKLTKAKKGQKVTVRGADGVVHKYRIVKIRRQNRGKGFSGVYTSTTGAPRLVLVTCTDEVHYTNGHFHYRKNLVVVAKPVK